MKSRNILVQTNSTFLFIMKFHIVIHSSPLVVATSCYKRYPCKPYYPLCIDPQNASTVHPEHEIKVDEDEDQELSSPKTKQGKMLSH